MTTTPACTNYHFSVSSAPEIDVDAFNMTLFCGEQTFDQVLTPVDHKWPIVTVLGVSTIVVLLLSLEMFICGATTNNFLNISTSLETIARTNKNFYFFSVLLPGFFAQLGCDLCSAKFDQLSHPFVLPE